MKKRKETI